MKKEKSIIKKLNDYDLIQLDKAIRNNYENPIIKKLNYNQKYLSKTKQKKILDIVNKEMFNRWKKILGY